ncbi:MAG: nucleotide exchange factor GrpE [Nitrospinota bacterium]
MEVSETQKDINLDKDIKKKSGEKSPQQEAKKNLTKKTKDKADKLEAIKKLFKKETEKLKTEIDAKDKESKENFDKFLRLNAEFENFKKRTQREKADSFKYASEKVIRDMIPVIDDLERALQATQNNDKVEDLSKGVEMIMNQIKNILESIGAKQFNSLDQVFDPNKHEAVSKVVTTEHEHNTIIEELRKGFMFHDRLLRPAMVVVAENVSEKEKETVMKTKTEKEEGIDKKSGEIN